MKNVATKVIPVRSIKVVSNGAGANRDKWMRIKDAKTGEVLHTGQPQYIKRVAKNRYSHLVG